MFKITKIELHFIPNPDMYILFEKGTTGGISYIYTRHNRPNNKHLKSYDRKEESKHIIYLDVKKFVWLCNVYIPSIKWTQIDKSYKVWLE